MHQMMLWNVWSLVAMAPSSAIPPGTGFARWSRDLRDLAQWTRTRQPVTFILILWATGPVWGKLSPGIRQSLIAADAAFLWHQLRAERITTLLLHGRSIIDAFTDAYGVARTMVQTVQDRRVSASLIAGVALHGIVGLSVNLQSSLGVTRAFGERLCIAAAVQVAAMEWPGG
jgi:hypothetical protein